MNFGWRVAPLDRVGRARTRAQRSRSAEGDSRQRPQFQRQDDARRTAGRRPARRRRAAHRRPGQDPGRLRLGRAAARRGAAGGSSGRAAQLPAAAVVAGPRAYGFGHAARRRSTYLVVEGVGASQASVRDAYDLVIWVETDEPTRLARDLQRLTAGEMSSPGAYAGWMAEENAYTTAERPWEHADLLVNGGDSIPYDPATHVVLADPPRLVSDSHAAWDLDAALRLRTWVRRKQPGCSRKLVRIDLWITLGGPLTSGQCIRRDEQSTASQGLDSGVFSRAAALAIGRDRPHVGRGRTPRRAGDAATGHVRAGLTSIEL